MLRQSALPLFPQFPGFDLATPQMKTHFLQVYYDRFINDPNYWAKQLVTKDGVFRYIVLSPAKNYFQPVMLDTIAEHISGSLTGSWVALDSNYCSKWCAWDCDVESDVLDRIEEELRSWNLNPLRESKRPGRAGHTWILFDQAVSASLLLRFNRYVQEKVGARDAGIEFFPKHPKTKSQLRGPLGLHRKPGANNARGWFYGVKEDCSLQLEWLMEQPLSSARIVTDAALCLVDADERQVGSRSIIGGTMRHTDRPFRDSAPILQLVSNLRRSGSGYVAQCPVCAVEGHDKSRDNLRISPDGSKFCCVYGGPAQIHEAREILDALNR
jgi:hypothetical protein